MWPEFERLTGDGGALAFGFPRQVPPAWRQNWQSVVHQVAVTPDISAKDRLLDSFASGSGVRTLGFVNAHAMNRAVDDPAFAADLLGLDHLVRDGIGVHALYKMIGNASGLNLNGTDLLPELIKRFAGRRVALFGTRLHLVDRVADMLRQHHGCEVITADGFQPDGFYLQRVAETRPDLVVLGMGMPKQERIACQMKRGLSDEVAIVCGGAILDFLSGDKPRAPVLLRRAGLEWAFRLSLEPRRLFRRYIVGNPLFLLRSAILAIGPQPVVHKPRRLPERSVSSQAFGIGGPVQPVLHATFGPPPEPKPPVLRTAVSVFSANRPVIARDDLYGRAADLDRMLTWVLDQGGNALIYGPRGYGKTSLVRVFGEIADSRRHVVLYASCSRDIGFAALMQAYLGELPGDSGATDAAATVQQVAARLAAVKDASIVLIIDEFDRIERDDTRQAIIELVKDVSDLTASVRFVIVGVATDAGAILGYHPSIQRCITCVPLSRLDAPAIASMFAGKASADGLDLAPSVIDTVVRLTAGSAYHAQLIGQKLVALARRDGRTTVADDDLDMVIADIVADAMLIDESFARLARGLGQADRAALLLALARRALADTGDRVRLSPADTALVALAQDLVADSVMRPVDTHHAAGDLRFINAFVPQLLLMAAHGAAATGDMTRQ